MIKFLYTIICFTIMLMAGCGYIIPERSADSLYLQLPAEPDTLNPITATDAYASTVLLRVYETLLDRNVDTLELEPKLAESYRISADRTHYSFTLKKGIFWSDGVEITADDIIYSYNRINDPNVPCAQLKVYYQDIKECRKINRYTVEFTYARPYFMALEFCGQMPIVPKHIFDDGTDFNKHKNNREPIGTGPYKFLRWKTGSSIELVRNENYHGIKPEIKTIVYKIIPESNVALQMLKKGDIDVISLRTIQWERQTVSEKFNENFYKLNYYLPNYNYIGWNSRRPFFSDARVRRAMTMLIDRESILEKLQYGHGQIVSGTFYIFSKANNSNVKPWPYDPEKAVSLLQEVGWKDTDGDGILDKDGVKFAFTMTISSGSKFAERIAVMLKEDFAKIGIEISINRYEWAVFLSKIQSHDFDAVPLAWSLGYSGDPYQLWHSSMIKQGSNYCAFSNAEADRLIEAARMEFDANKRNKMYHRFHEILHEEQPYTFLFCNPELVVVSKRFQNVNVHLMGLEIVEWQVMR